MPKSAKIIDNIALRADENLLKHTTVLDILRDIRLKHEEMTEIHPDIENTSSPSRSFSDKLTINIYLSLLLSPG